jgi:hypothetical protein
VGGAALFAHRENGRLVLLRTLPIERVEYRGAPLDGPESTVVLGPEVPWEPAVASPHGYPAPTPMADPPTEPLSMDAVEAARVAYASLDAHVERDGGDEAMPLDLEDLLSISVTEVTLSLPLYRPPVPRGVLPPARPPPVSRSSPSTHPPAAPGPAAGRSPPHAPPRRSVVGPGRRLR